jgi:hypothetical protein
LKSEENQRKRMESEENQWKIGEKHGKQLKSNKNTVYKIIKT